MTAPGTPAILDQADYAAVHGGIVALLVDLLLIAWLLYTMNRLLIIGNVVIFAITVVAAVIVNKYRVDTRP